MIKDRLRYANTCFESSLKCTEIVPLSTVCPCAGNILYELSYSVCISFR
jgi:hypothetical protein